MILLGKTNLGQNTLTITKFRLVGNPASYQVAQRLTPGVLSPCLCVGNHAPCKGGVLAAYAGALIVPSPLAGLKKKKKIPTKLNKNTQMLLSKTTNLKTKLRDQIQGKSATYDLKTPQFQNPAVRNPKITKGVLLKSLQNELNTTTEILNHFKALQNYPN